MIRCVCRRRAQSRRENRHRPPLDARTFTLADLILAKPGRTPCAAPARSEYVRMSPTAEALAGFDVRHLRHIALSFLLKA
jgi:hypothetical protein